MDQNNNYFDLDSVSEQKPTDQKQKKQDRGAFLAGIVVGLLSALAVVGVVFLVGEFAGKEGNNTGFFQIGGSETVKLSEDGLVSKSMISKIESLVGLIHKEFYLKEMTDEELQTGVYKGLLEALADPYSEYYTPQELEELMAGSEGIYYGIGAYVSMDTDTGLPKISGVIKGTPAEEAGLRSNDILYEIDEKNTYGLSLSEAVALIRGDENTQVKLSIVREGKQIDVSVTRRRVESPTVESRMLDDRMGYLQITEFDDVTTGQFLRAMEELNRSGMKGLVLDLRSNPGGNLSTVVEIAQNLLPEGTIVYTENKAGKKEYYESKGDKEIQIPMVVLIDMNSASASEILAGAIQDYGKGKLVGTTTFGKGIVQSVIPLRDGSAVKITVSSYYTPKGRNIHGIGIEPDIVCEFDGEKYYNTDNPIDNQLEKAKEVLADMIK